VNLLKRQLSVANVISCLALFVALSGVAYAATTVAKKSVKTQHLGNGAVTTLKLRNGAVTTAKIRNMAVSAAKLGPGAVVSEKLANGAVRSAALGGGVVTEGKIKKGAVTGEKIANGAIYGPQLAPDSVGTGKILDGSITAKEISPLLVAQIFRNLSYVKETSESSTSVTKSASPECPVSKEAIGGGAQIIGTNTGVAITGSAPNLGTSSTTRSWATTAQAVGTQTDPWAIEAYVVCAELRVP
jgi:hypothetical protein